MKNDDWIALASILAPQLDAAVREGMLDGGRRVGEWRSWRANGSLLVSAWFEDGRRHGDWTRWHPNGGRQLVMPFDHGRARGTLTGWYASGGMALRSDVSRGRLHGAFQVWRADATRWAHGLFRRGSLVRIVRTPLPRAEASPQRAVRWPEPPRAKGREVDRPLHAPAFSAAAGLLP